MSFLDFLKKHYECSYECQEVRGCLVKLRCHIKSFNSAAARLQAFNVLKPGDHNFVEPIEISKIKVVKVRKVKS